MGREIEIKIPITKKEFDFLRDVFYFERKTLSDVEVLKNSPKQILKQDEYWSRYKTREERIQNGEAQVIRIRTEKINDDEKSYFTIKHKTYENGIELNKEDETFIENPDVLREFFLESDYQKWFEKTKLSFSSLCRSSLFGEIIFHVEIENVNDLLYAEIEVTQEIGDAQNIKNALNEFSKQIGLSPEKKDSRSWVEILKR